MHNDALAGRLLTVVSTRPFGISPGFASRCVRRIAAADSRPDVARPEVYRLEPAAAFLRFMERGRRC